MKLNIYLAYVLETLLLSVYSRAIKTYFHTKNPYKNVYNSFINSWPMEMEQDFLFHKLLSSLIMK